MTERHDVMVSPEQKAKLDDLKWSLRASASSIISDLVNSYAEGSPREAGPAQPAPVRVRTQLDDGVWEQAQRRAAVESTTVSEAIRKMIDAISVP